MAKRNLKLDTPDNIRKALAKVANMTYKGKLIPRPLIASLQRVT